MSSWFGGPPSSSGRENRHEHEHRDSTSGTSIRHDSRGNYFTRPRSPSSQGKPGSYSTRPHSSSSYYKRRPRDGYMKQMAYKIKKMLRDLVAYARRHPVKIFMLVIMPLITGGALHNLLRRFGIRLPAGLAGFGGSGLGGRGESGGSGFGNMGGSGGAGGLQSVMNIAKMFM